MIKYLLENCQKFQLHILCRIVINYFKRNQIFFLQSGKMLGIIRLDSGKCRETMEKFEENVDSQMRNDEKKFN